MAVVSLATTAFLRMPSSTKPRNSRRYVVSPRRPHQSHVELIYRLNRDLSPWDVPVAEAAAMAGFDCSDWLRLKGLLDAVRAANAPVTYPDRWTGKLPFIRGMEQVTTSQKGISFIRCPLSA